MERRDLAKYNHRSEKPQIKSGADLEKQIAVLKRSREQLEDLVAPHSLSGKFRFALAKRFPSLRDRIEATPLENVRADMRGVLIDITQNLPEMVSNGKDTINNFQELKELYANAKESEKRDLAVGRDHVSDETWDLGMLLKERLHKEGEEDLDLSIDAKTQEIINQILTFDNMSDKREELERVFGEAEQRLTLAEPIVEVTAASIKANVKLRDAMMSQYSTLLDASPALDALHRNSGSLLNGMTAGRVSNEVVIRVLEDAMATVELTAKSREFISRLDDARDLPRLAQVGADAEAFLKTMNLTESGVKFLTSGSEESSHDSSSRK